MEETRHGVSDEVLGDFFNKPTVPYLLETSHTNGVSGDFGFYITYFTSLNT
jgi:hypothetical protein